MPHQRRRGGVSPGRTSRTPRSTFPRLRLIRKKAAGPAKARAAADRYFNPPRRRLFPRRTFLVPHVLMHLVSGCSPRFGMIVRWSWQKGKPCDCTAGSSMRSQPVRCAFVPFRSAGAAAAHVCFRWFRHRFPACRCDSLSHLGLRCGFEATAWAQFVPRSTRDGTVRKGKSRSCDRRSVG